MLPGDFVQAHSAGAILQDRFLIDLEFGTSDPPAFKFRPPKRVLKTPDQELYWSPI